MRRLLIGNTRLIFAVHLGELIVPIYRMKGVLPYLNGKKFFLFLVCILNLSNSICLVTLLD
jgi:hypothetical protein